MVMQKPLEDTNMMDDLDRECCASVEALVKNGIRSTYWDIIENKFNDPGMEILLEWRDPSGKDNRHPRVKVKIEYGYDER
jgi:hypothetical protein